MKHLARRGRLAAISSISFIALITLGAAPIRAGAEPRTFEIRAASAVEALREFAQQSKSQTLFDFRRLKDRRTRAVSGALEPEEALRQMLRDSGLTFDKVGERTFAIRAISDDNFANVTGVQGLRVAAAASQLRVAQSDSTRADSQDGAVSSKSTQNTASQSVEEVTPTVRGIPEVLVKGSRSLNADVRRTEDDVQPYVIFSREQVERSMATDLEDFLKKRLPMNSTSFSHSNSVNSPNGNQSQINLRGLGTNQTLVLVNGKRIPSVSNIANSGDLEQPDINGIPLSAIERIEVLPSTASGIYGGGATGGVVNIILRKDYSSFEVRANYENTFDGDAAQRRIDLNAGFALEGGKTQVIFSSSFSDSNPLLTRERDFAERSRALLLKNDSAALMGGYFPPQGYTSNIRSAQPNSNANLVLKDGRDLGSPFTHTPVGYEGPASDGGAAFLANAGRFNLDMPDTLIGKRTAIVNSPTTSALTLSVRREFGDTYEVFADASTVRNRGRSFYANTPFVVQLAADSPHNPFTTAIDVVFPTTSLHADVLSESRTDRVGGGILMRLPANWSINADYGWGRSRSGYSDQSPIIGPDGMNALEEGLMDVLRDLNAFPLDFSQYLSNDPYQVIQPSDTVLTDVTLRAAGPLFALPAGPVVASGMIESRKERAADTFHTQTNRSFDGGDFTTRFTWFPGRQNEVTSAYLEVFAPLLSAESRVTGVRSLEFQVSMRRDTYETTGVPTRGIPVESYSSPRPSVVTATNKLTSTDSTVGLRYMPIEDLALRVSRSTGFLPPSVAQVVSNRRQAAIYYVDPKRGGTNNNPITYIDGGNSDLLPERSIGWSAGAILTPRFVPGFRLSIDYTQIEKTDEILSMFANDVLAIEDEVPGRVMREPLSDADAALGYTGGLITAIDTSRINIASATVRAFDVQLNYQWATEQWGAFELYALGSRQLKLARKTLPNSPTIDRVGYSDGPLKWRGNFGLIWEKSSWAVGWNAQYYDEHYVYRSSSSQVSRERMARQQGSHTIPVQMFHDITVRYRFDSANSRNSLLSNTQFTIGIENVFDKSPAIQATTTPIGGFSYFGDPRMRSYTFTVSKSFD